MSEGEGGVLQELTNNLTPEQQQYLVKGGELVSKALSSKAAPKVGAALSILALSGCVFAICAQSNGKKDHG